MDEVRLGNTGIGVSRLSFGTGTNGWNGRSNQTDLGLDELSNLLLYAHSHGITFWDSADQYGSHPHVAQALSSVRRDSVVITTKTCAGTAEEAERDIDRYLTELGTDYIDIVLMHCMADANWPGNKAGVMDVLARKKEQGVLRSHGVSCHDFGALQTAAEIPWVETVLARINYAGKNMEGPPEKVIPILERMHEADIGIYGMKVVACGDLAQDAMNAIHYVLDLPCVDAITVGMKSRQEVDENIGWVEAHEQDLRPA
jgi:aryl-alcohol dehydrogenase-like predicted oxidoreductase